MPANLIAYPFLNWNYHGLPSQLSETAAHEITQVRCPIVEIGGPTERGYRLLQDRELLPCRPVITNKPGYRGMLPKHVDEAQDGSDLSYDPESVGMFLASHIGRVNYDTFPSPETIPRHELEAAQNVWDALAEQEYDELLSDPSFKAVHNLRVSVLQEMSRCLRMGGLILFEGIGEKDLSIARQLGCSILFQAISNATIYTLDCLLQKQDISALKI